jgi:hypothetical protein
MATVNRKGMHRFRETFRTIGTSQFVLTKKTSEEVAEYYREVLLDAIPFAMWISFRVPM